jgi:hypothetical protein
MFHPLLQLGGAFGNRWHGLSHPAPPLLMWEHRSITELCIVTNLKPYYHSFLGVHFD